MIHIIADTTCSIPVPDAQKRGLTLLPQMIILVKNTYRDDNEITTEEFLRKLKSSPTLPKTAAPPPALYNPIFQECASSGDTAIVITPSAELSGTFRSASIAAQDFPHADIRIIDSRTIGSGLGMLVMRHWNGADPISAPMRWWQKWKKCATVNECTSLSIPWNICTKGDRSVQRKCCLAVFSK